MSEADKTNTPAAGGEPQIPKHRFDELAAQLKRLEEANQMKDQTIGQLIDAQKGAEQPQQEDQEILEALDPAQLKAVRKLLGGEIAQREQQFMQAIGGLGNKLDEQEFLLNNGKDKSKYLPRIREMRTQYARQNVPLTSEMAYKMIRVEEMEAKANKEIDGNGGNDPNPNPGKEPPANTAAATPPPSNPAEGEKPLTIEEMEAQLDEQLSKSGLTI